MVDQQSTEQQADDADYQRVTVACAQLQATGRYPSVASVQAHLKEHLGGGIKTARISGLIRRWEAETKATKRTAKAAPEALPPDIDAVLDAHPDLAPVVEAMLAATSKLLADRAQQEAATRVQAVASAIEAARDVADKREAEVASAHAAELAERETVIEQLRTEQAAMVDEITDLKDKVSDRDVALERAGQDYALAKTEARTATTKVADFEVRLAAAERRASDAESRAGDVERTVDKLRSDLAASQQSVAAAVEARQQIAGLVDGLRSDVAAERQRSDALHERIEQLTRDLAIASAAAKQP